MMFPFSFQVRIDFYSGKFPSKFMTAHKQFTYDSTQNWQIWIPKLPVPHFNNKENWALKSPSFCLLCPVRNWVYMPRRFFMWVKKQLGAQVEENDPLCWFSRGVSTSGNSKHNFRRCPITICVQVHFNFHVLVQTSLNRKS